MAAVDDLNVAIAQLVLAAVNNFPITANVLAQLQAVTTELSPGPPLDELNASITQLSLCAQHNAPANPQTIDALNDVVSQLTLGTLTTNPDSLAAIDQLTQIILDQEPDWTPLLWVNFDDPSSTLTVQVRGMYTWQAVCTATPWWTAWDDMYEAADDVMATIYFNALPEVSALRRTANTCDGCSVTPQSGPGGPWTGAGWIYTWAHPYTNTTGPAGGGQPVGFVTYMASYFGIAQEASTNNVSLSVWPGIQPTGATLRDGSHFVVQPVLIRQHPAATDNLGRLQWILQPTINGTQADGTNNQTPGPPVRFGMPQGIWGVMRETGTGWVIGFYRGNKGNTGPNFGKPLTTLTVPFSDPFYGKMLTLGNRMQYPVCVVEVTSGSPGVADGTYTCTDLNIKAVFGGITMQQHAQRLPVNWTAGTNQGSQPPLLINCITAEDPVAQPTINGQTQLSVTYSPSTP